MKDKKELKIVNIISTIILFLTVFYLMNKYVNKVFASDYPSHINHSLRGDSYSLIALPIVVFCGFMNSRTLFAVFMSIVILLTIMACGFFVKRITRIMNTNINSKLLIVPLSTIFICKICIPEWSPLYYQASLSTQPWHNSTFTLMRMFAIISLYLFFKIQKKYDNKVYFKDLFVFTLILFLTNFAKPSFIMAFAPIVLFELIRDFVKTKGRNFKNEFLIGICVLISCSILIYQYSASFGSSSNSDGGIAFSLSNFINYFIENKKYPIYFFLSFAYPLYILYLCIKNRKALDSYSKKMYIQTWLMYVLSFIESLVLVETGSRAADGNFGWGSLFFAYILFVMSICMHIKLRKEKLINDSNNTIAVYTYALHIMFGVCYFVLLCMGYHYYF